MIKKRNRLIVILVIVCVFGIGLLEGFIKPQIKIKEEKYKLDQRSPLTHDFSSVLKYANKYMGNASNFINLNNNLPMNNLQKKYQLYPKQLTVLINYENAIENFDATELRQMIIYNSTANFVLIDNINYMEMRFAGVTYKLSRKELQEWYRVPLASLKNSKTFKDKVQAKLKDPVYLEEFFKANVKIL